MIGLAALWFALSVLLALGLAKWFQYQREQDLIDENLRNLH